MKTSYDQRMAQLNSYQRQAVLDDNRACLVNACVGSGKTTVLTLKTEYLHREKGIPYENMMVLTFTNKAAGEIRDRLQLQETDSLKFGTFHSVAKGLLDQMSELTEIGWQQNFDVMEPEEELELAEQLIKSHKLKVKYKNRLGKRLEQEKHLWRDGGQPKYKDDLFALYPLLTEEKKRRNCMSFDDLMENTLVLLKEKAKKGTLTYPDWLIVDEVQDCNRQQMDFLKLLYGHNTHLFAVGDPNQMIYSFRGGDSTLFYRWKTEFAATELSLPINYRSEASILKLASRFQQYGQQIQGKGADSGKETGDFKPIPVHNYYDPFLEAEVLAEKIMALHEEGCPYGEIAILYRMQEQSAQLEKNFERQGIPCQVYKRKITGQVDAKTPGQTEHSDTSETKNNTPKPNISEAGSNNPRPDATDSVHLLTLHACKGLEFDHVFIIGLNQGLIPLKGSNEAQREEEERLFFVGMTRARKGLEFSWYTNPNQPQVSGEMSPFLKRIPAGMLAMEQERLAHEKTEHLNMLRKEILRQRQTGEVEDVFATEKTPSAPNVRRASHPHYGVGTVTEEDDMMIEVEFPEYGKKQFMKMFGEITLLD